MCSTYVQHYLKNDLKYKHSGATGKLVGVVSIKDITVYYGSNSTAMSAAYVIRTYECQGTRSTMVRSIVIVVFLVVFEIMCTYTCRAVARVYVCVALHSLLLSTGCRVSYQNTRGSKCT
jgi:hypothetical protein